MKILSDSMWKEIEKVLPKKKSKVGRPENDKRVTMDGIAYVLKTGIQWRLLPKEYGPFTSVHGTFIKLAKDGFFEKLLNYLGTRYLSEKGMANNWFATDTSSSKALFANWAGKNPTDRSKHGIKKGIIVDRKGAPLAIMSGPANSHDSKFYIPLLEKLKTLPLPNLVIMAADSAYDSKKLRNISRENKIILLASTNPRRKKDVSIYKPRHRWIVERTFGWMHWYRSLKTCWAKSQDAFTAMLAFASANQVFRMI